jgi:hypothetical protein
MTNYVTITERPTLREPVLVVMLSGWIDASGAAAAAMSVLESECSARTIATFDRDTFIDYRARRPVMEIREGRNSRLVWPDIELKVGRDRSGRDVLLLTGHEPDMAWSRFAQSAADLAVEFGVTKAIGIGAYPLAVPHTRSPRLSCTAPDVNVVARLPFIKSSVDVPAGMEAVLEQTFFEHSIETFGIWVQVPHYVSQMSYPAATVALLNALGDATNLVVDDAGPRSEALLQRSRLDDLVTGNKDHEAMVHQLEQLYDSDDGFDNEGRNHPSMSGPIDGNELPSGDELAAELEQFLRDQG